jgi:prevent-host-death family protein
MRTMSIRELRAALSALEEIVENDGEIVVTRHGRPLAKVVPMSPRCAAPSHAGLRATIPYQTVPAEVLIREDRERG